MVQDNLQDCSRGPLGAPLRVEEVTADRSEPAPFFLSVLLSSLSSFFLFLHLACLSHWSTFYSPFG